MIPSLFHYYFFYIYIHDRNIYTTIRSKLSNKIMKPCRLLGNPAWTPCVAWLIPWITLINSVVSTIKLLIENFGQHTFRHKMIILNFEFILLCFSSQMLALAQPHSIYMKDLWSATPTTVNEIVNIRVFFKNSKRTTPGYEFWRMTFFLQTLCFSYFAPSKKS